MPSLRCLQTVALGLLALPALAQEAKLKNADTHMLWFDVDQESHSHPGCGDSKYRTQQRAKDPNDYDKRKSEFQAAQAARKAERAKDINQPPPTSKGKQGGRRLMAAAAPAVTYELKVHVIVLYSTTTQNLSLTKINGQIQTLNDAFGASNTWDKPWVSTAHKSLAANPGIRFPTLTSANVERYQVASGYTCQMDKEQTQYKATYKGKDPKQFLNIWICPSVSPEPGQPPIDGYAAYPWMACNSHTVSCDGLTMVFSSFGPGLNTATHELGHYLGLLHTFGDIIEKTSGGDGDGVDCTEEGISDTPAVEAYGHMTLDLLGGGGASGLCTCQYAWTHSSCTGTQYGCSECDGYWICKANPGNGCTKDQLIDCNTLSELDATGQIDTCPNKAGKDMWYNFMEYASDPYLNVFTIDQVAAMRYTLETSRSGIVVATAPPVSSGGGSCDSVWINEFDAYDGGLGEFIELWNDSPNTVSLSGCTLVIYNGKATTTAPANVVLSAHQLSGSIGPNGVMVVGDVGLANVGLAMSGWTLGSSNLQDGGTDHGDMIALYSGRSASDFIPGTTVCTAFTSHDSIVYSRYSPADQTGQEVCGFYATTLQDLASPPTSYFWDWNAQAWAVGPPTPGVK